MKGFERGWKEFLKSQLLLIDIYKGKVDKINQENWLTLMWPESPENIISLAIAESATLSDRAAPPSVIETIKNEGFSGFVELIGNFEITLDTALEILWILAPLWDRKIESLLRRSSDC